MSTATSTTSPQLLTQLDWPKWFEFIRKQAKFAQIWEYVDPDKKENEIKVNTEPQAPGSHTAADAAAATLWTRQYELYKIQRQDYLKLVEKLQTYAQLILGTIGQNFSGYLREKITPYEILKTLQDVAKPSEATLRKMVKDEMSRRDQGPKRQSIEAWLQLHISIIQQAKELKTPLAGAEERSIAQAFIEDCEEICPLMYNTYGHQVITGSGDVSMAKLIAEFNLLYKPKASGRHAHATLSGLPTASESEPVEETNPATKKGASAGPACHACGLLHKVRNCKQLFKPLRGPNFVADDAALKKCDQWLKIPENRQFYERQLKWLEKKTPTELPSNEVKDLHQPRATASCHSRSIPEPAPAGSLSSRRMGI